MGQTKLTTSERIGRSVGKVRRVVNTATQRLRRRTGGGGVEGERFRDIFGRRRG